MRTQLAVVGIANLKFFFNAEGTLLEQYQDRFPRFTGLLEALSRKRVAAVAATVTTLCAAMSSLIDGNTGILSPTGARSFAVITVCCMSDPSLTPARNGTGGEVAGLVTDSSAQWSNWSDWYFDHLFAHDDGKSET